MSQSSMRFRSPTEWTYLWLPLLPIIGLLTLLAYGVVQERLAAGEVRELKAELRSDDIALTNQQLTRWFDQHTSREHTDEWRDVFLATIGLQSRFGSLTLMVEGFEEFVPPGESWDDEPIVSEYIEDAQVIIDQIEKIVDNPRPTWQPLLFTDFSTLLGELQESRGIMQLLAREFRMAVYQDDSARALRAIRLMRGLEKSFDWRIGLISELVATAHRAAIYTALRPSLEIEFWSSEELDQISEWLREDIALDQRWKDSLASELAMGIQALESPESLRGALDAPVFPFGVAPSAKLRFLDELQRQMEIEGVGTVAHVREIKKIGDMVSDGIEQGEVTITGIPLANTELLVALYWPSYSSASAAIARTEGERRWTLTAVGIRQFRLQENRWPTELSELSELGLSSEVWEAFPGEPFGYAVDESGTALLWSLDTTQWGTRNPTISYSPPTQDDLGSMPLDTALMQMYFQKS